MSLKVLHNVGEHAAVILELLSAKGDLYASLFTDEFIMCALVDILSGKKPMNYCKYYALSSVLEVPCNPRRRSNSNVARFLILVGYFVFDVRRRRG